VQLVGDIANVHVGHDGNGSDPLPPSRSYGAGVRADPFGFDSLDPQRVRARPGAKWQRHSPALAAWVADMDFEPCPAVADALRRRLDAGALGYPDWRSWHGGTDTQEVFVERAAQRFGWAIDRSHTWESSDVVQSVQTMIHLCTAPGDGIVLHTPSYPPLRHAVESMGRRIVEVPAVWHPHGVQFDHDELDQRLRHEAAEMILLCHPHNPTGHVFSEAELRTLADIAERHDLVIVSDEIHADLVYAPATHIPMGVISPDRAITIHSASKSFNLAGLRYAITHIGPAWVRQRLHELPDHLTGAINVFGADAAAAAWRDGDEWLAALVAHLDRNRSRLGELLAAHLPGVVYRPPNATYLAWLDCTALVLGDDPAAEFRRRGVALSPGLDFGAAGAGCVRLNMATSGAILEQIVTAMATP
jgi:cystathionine beta-lyase